MKQMTIRSLDPQLEAGIETLARQRDWSVNQVATHLMRKGLGLTDETAPHMIGNQLDRFMGNWTGEEADAFDQTVGEAFGRIDEEHWK